MPIPQQWLQFAPKPRDLANGEKWNVFLSYRSINRNWVLNLYDVLKELDYKVFLDQYEIIGGDELIQRLQDGLTNSQSGILIWSTAASDSVWVDKEYQTMETRATRDPRFKFVPVKLDGRPLPIFAANRVFEDFSSYPDGPNGGELLRLIYAITGEHMSKDAIDFANKQSQLAADMINELNAARITGDAESIVQLYHSNILPWKTTASLGCTAGENLIKLRKYNEAIELLQSVENDFPKAIRPRQLHALALARRGQNDDLNQAQKILAKLYAAGERDPETLGIFARTWMDRYNKSGDIADLRQSRNYYEDGYKRAPDDNYTGINAASKSVLLDEYEKGAAIAKKILENLGTQAVPGDYWTTVTIAEALLDQKQYTDAGNMYQQGIDIAPMEYGSHESTWGQAQLLMEKLKPTPEERALIAKPFMHLLRRAAQNA